MGIKLMDSGTWRKRRSRVLLAGEPGSRKTTSLLTWPRPLHVLVMPGEKGAASIEPDPANGVHVYVYEDDLTGKTLSQTVVQEITRWTAEILAGKHGKVETFAVDGLHKLVDPIMNKVTAGEYLAGGEFEPTKWGAARRELGAYIDMAYNSIVPNVVFTCWVAPEKDRPTRECKSTHIWPDLPGQLAKKCLGEFTAVVVARPIEHPKTKELLFVWQLQPDDLVWGCGVKCPPDIAKTIPRFIPQDYKTLMAVLDGKAGATAQPQAETTQGEGGQ